MRAVSVSPKPRMWGRGFRKADEGLPKPRSLSRGGATCIELLAYLRVAPSSSRGRRFADKQIKREAAHATSSRRETARPERGRQALQRKLRPEISAEVQAQLRTSALALSHDDALRGRSSKLRSKPSMLQGRSVVDTASRGGAAPRGATATQAAAQI